MDSLSSSTNFPTLFSHPTSVSTLFPPSLYSPLTPVVVSIGLKGVLMNVFGVISIIIGSTMGSDDPLHLLHFICSPLFFVVFTSVSSSHSHPIFPSLILSVSFVQS